LPKIEDNPRISPPIGENSVRAKTTVTKNLSPQLEQRLPSESLDLIRAAGELARELGLYLVGGVVRDLLLGRATFDLDLVVEGDAPKLANLLAQRKGGQIVVHRRFGTAKFRCQDLSIDLATARAETYAHPGALPTVRPGSINDDLLRRDFTINAMAIHLDPDNFGKLVDPFGGEKDLGHKLVRILHEKSFVDDATRMLRAIRYEQRFDFQLETTTAQLLRRDLAMLHTISGDRIRHELELIFKEEHPEKPLQRAAELGLLQEIHPSLKGDGWLRGKFQQARSITYPTPLGLYFSLLVYHLSQEEGEDFITRLRIPGATARAVRDTLRLKENLLPLTSPELSPSAIYRLLQDYSPTSILTCAIASESALIMERLHLYLNKLRYVKTSLNGRTLQQMGISPGPRLGEILRQLHDAKLDQRVKTRAEEMELVRLWLPQGG
jgi:tRNA nucleotidyltransferase (CCA-adding enzyme)